MAVTSKISPFYDPGAPPPPVPLLTSQVEFCYEPTHATTITAQEEIPLMPTTTTQPKSPLKARFQSPLTYRDTKSTPGPPRRYNDISDLSDLSELDPSGSDSESSESESSVNSKDGMIAKPQGESGRPNRGGYNLQKTLGWNPRQYKKVKIFINRQADEKLDPRKCYSEQHDDLLQSVRDTAVERFDDLDNYIDCWPVDDFLKARLKITSARWRREQRIKEGDSAKEQAEQLRGKAKKAKKAKKHKV